LSWQALLQQWLPRQTPEAHSWDREHIDPSPPVDPPDELPPEPPSAEMPVVPPPVEPPLVVAPPDVPAAVVVPVPPFPPVPLGRGSLQAVSTAAMKRTEESLSFIL
jgi:hypothetical protein